VVRTPTGFIDSKISLRRQKTNSIVLCDVGNIFDVAGRTNCITIHPSNVSLSENTRN